MRTLLRQFSVLTTVHVQDKQIDDLKTVFLEGQGCVSTCPKDPCEPWPTCPQGLECNGTADTNPAKAAPIPNVTSKAGWENDGFLLFCGEKQMQHEDQVRGE